MISLQLALVLPEGPYLTKNGALIVESSTRGIVENLDAELKPAGLTSREIQILRQLALGKGDKEISISLLISVKTVNHHVSNIILKLDAKNRTHAVAKALLTRLIEMRATDALAGTFNRRRGDQGKAIPIRRVTHEMSVSVGCHMPEDQPEDQKEALPWPTPEGRIKSKSAI
jgi:DNA-binding CsgD family transcriptional regulator